MSPTTRPGVRSLILAGAGIPGLSLALALKQAHGPALAVTVCDPGLGAGALPHRGRAYAVAAGGRRMLDRLGVWGRLGPAAQAMTAMAITDSRLADPVRPVFLTFEREAFADDDEPFAHMVEAEPLAEALLDAAREAGVAFEAAGVAGAEVAGSGVRAALADGRVLAGSLLVAADGARSRLREAARIGWVGWAYPQTGIVATIRHAKPHAGRAYEHFLPGGPFAILPLADAAAPDGDGLVHRSSIVWTEARRDAPALLAGDAGEVLAEIARRFTGELGAIAIERAPTSHPLSVGLARAFRAPRLALLGDAAHVIHPVAGQGLNLGLADAAALAEGVTEALRLGLDPGAEPVLAAYERARRPAALAMAAATDGLNRLFSNDALPLRLARDLGLGLVDRSPGLKRLFVARAAAVGAGEPRLLRGEAL